MTPGERFRIETACDGYAALTEDDVPDWVVWDGDVDSYIAGARDAAEGIRGVLGEVDPASGTTGGLAAALEVILARTRCELIHAQTNGGRCVNCISWAKTIGAPRHLPRLLASHAEDAAPAGCECPPCPGRGNDGHGMTHCAECCFGTGVEADPDCPIHGAAPAGGVDAIAAVLAAQVEVEAVLRDRMDYGTSGRLIADSGETYQSLAEHIAAALAASGDEGHDEERS